MDALGENLTKYNFNKPDPGLLEIFSNPFADSRNHNNVTGRILIVAPEFTSLCPVTGQPDFATINIEYIPQLHCIESKSLKLYLMSYRNHGEFHEACINRICNDLIDILVPKWIQVKGEFTPRGGIPFWPTATWPTE